MFICIFHLGEIYQMKLFKLRVIFSILFVFSLIFISHTDSTYAADVSAPTKDQVFQSAPDGLNLNGLIEDPNYTNGTNDAKLNTDFPVNIVEMLTKDGANNQISSFWGKKYKSGDSGDLNNYFDLTKKQTISAWIYTGDVYHFYTEKPASKDDYTSGMNDSKTPDGLALVLQNDSRGAKAISTAISGDNAGSPSYGETLGVWGGSTTDHAPIVQKQTGSYPSKTLFTDKLQNGAIQNSFAIELDMLQNFNKPKVDTNLINQTLSGKDDYFDSSENYKGQHITFGYPGESSTYKDYPLQFNPSLFQSASTYYFSQVYPTGTSGTANNVQMSGYLSKDSSDTNLDKSWKHFTFTYTPVNSTTGNFRYAFNDKERDGTAKPINIPNTGSGTIDLTKFGDTKDVRWGFTASTGSQYSAPNDIAIVMQQMPSTANVQSTVKLTDMSQYGSDGTLGREISNLNNNSLFRPNSSNPMSGFTSNSAYNVANNDKLRFQYDLSYTSGTLGTGEISTNLKLPENVNFTPDTSSDDQTIGKIVYTGTDNESEDISASDITENSDGEKVLNLKLKNMDDAGQQATIYLNGQADSGTTPKLVSGEVTSFRSQNYIEDVTSPTFIINDQLKNSTTKAEQDVTVNDDVTISGTTNYAHDSTFDANGITIHTKINGKDLDDTKVETAKGDKTANYSMVATKASSSGSPLKIGKNTIEVYAVDSMNRVSNTQTYTINVKDYKDLILASTNDDPMTAKITDSIQLNSQAHYSNGDLITKLSTLTGYVKIDDGDFKQTNFSGGSVLSDITTLYLNLAAGKLSVGQHTVQLYINDGTRDSNTVTYHINVINKNLILTANSDDTNQTVYDNSDVKLRGAFNYEDNSDFINKTTKIKYQITTADGTKQAEVTKEVDPQSTNKADFSIDLEPIGKKLLTGSSTQTVDDYLKTATGLKVGRNEVTVTAYDGDDATSNTVTYVINVPDITPTISSDKLSQTVITQMNLNFPLEFTYPDVSDHKYELQTQDLAIFANAKDSSDAPTMTVLDQPKSSEGKVETPYTLKAQSQWVKNLIVGDNDVSVYLMDPYLRKTNTLDFKLDVLPKGTQIEVGNYRFETIDPKEKISDYVKRDGNWNVKIDSYHDKWNLRAQASNMLHQDLTGQYTESSNLELVDFNKNNNTATSLTQNPVVASGDTSDAATPVSYKLFGSDSDDNDGIMLKTNGIPLSGEYMSIIQWLISDSV